MHRIARIVSTFSVVSALLAFSAAASAEEDDTMEEPATEELPEAEPILQTGETTVTVGGIGRAQFRVQNADDTADEVGLNVIAGRINARAKQHRLGQAFVQIEAGNDLSLLDVIVDINLGSPVGVRLGQFKTPVSREFLIGLPRLQTFDRARLTRVAPRRRAGVDVYGDFDFDGWWLRADAGLYNPTGALDLSDSGQLMAERIDVGFDFGLSFHLAYAQHVLGENFDPMTSGPITRYDRLIDAAIVFEHDGFNALAEGVYSADGPGDTEPLGAYLLFAYLFGTDEPGEGFGYEPAVGADWVDYDEGTVFKRVMGTFNWLINGRKLQASVGYSAEQTSDEDVGHVAALQMQGAF
jgi:hypothetical protein